MQRELVERRRWVSSEDYLEGLALAQLAPGPMAAQLAIYLGYLRAGIPGASLVGLAFVGPSFLMVFVIAAAYVRFGGLPWMQPAFHGIGAAVIAIIARSASKLARMVLRNDRILWSTGDLVLWAELDLLMKDDRGTWQPHLPLHLEKCLATFLGFHAW